MSTLVGMAAIFPKPAFVLNLPLGAYALVDLVFVAMALRFVTVLIRAFQFSTVSRSPLDDVETPELIAGH